MSDQSAKQGVLAAFSCALIAYGLFISTVGALATQSADLFALWTAGEFMAMGRVDQIYPATADYFDMTTPSDWWAHVSQSDPSARVFPYIYPPIWAKLMSFIAPLTSFTTFDTVFLVLHQILLMAAIYLATRMCDLRGISQLLVVAMTYTALVITTPIGLALAENQPQILVSFLIVFAFERAHFNHPRAAGALLALAAAIKVYPVLFVAIFAARRQWPAAVSFAVTGLALGLTSIALAGWPLHAEYLNLIKTLTRSIVATNFSFSIDAYIGGTLFVDDLVKVQQPQVATVSAGWSAMGKPALWVMMSTLANLLALGFIAWLAARRPRDPLVLAVAAILLALLSPLSWAYTYLTALVFAGALPQRLRPLGLEYAGFALMVTMVVVFHRSIPSSTFGRLDLGLTGGWLLGGALFALLGVAMLWAVLRTKDDVTP